MGKLTALLLRRRRLVIGLFSLLAALAALLIPAVRINYDLAEYLPPGSGSRQALEILEGEFSAGGNAMLMAERISVSEALALKGQLEAVEGVDSVLWLDDAADLRQPLSQISRAYRDTYYRDGKALYYLTFTEDDYSLKTGAALAACRELAAGYNPALYGAAEESRATRAAVKSEMFNIMVVVVPLCLLVLVLISTSWFEPVLYVFVILIAVVLNMGTNIIFDQVSFIISSMGAAIQLAVSMDYSLFLTHRFEEEYRKGLPVEQAVIVAVRRTFSSIFASALTTVAGFAALAFMEYGIGRDIGFVLAKGVALSFLCVILFLPPLLVSCHRLIDRTRHRAWLEISAGLARALVRFRYLFLALTLLLVIPAFLGQRDTGFLYGDSSGSSASGRVALEKDRIQETYVLNDQVVILAPNGNIAAEQQLCRELLDRPYVESVQALVTVADPAVPRSLLPAKLLDNFVGKRYSRLIVYVNLVDESPDMFAAVTDLRQRTQSLYGDGCYLVGKAVSVADIRASVLTDMRKTMDFSMLAVAAVILFTFRSLIMPLLLVAVIQSAIYINMAVPYFQGRPLVFIGYLVVSSLQLGATIDYAILLASRYREARREWPPREAAAQALHCSGISVVTSGLILAIAGFAESRLSQMAAVSDIGLLIGRGALLSTALVLLVLPAVLTLFDKPIGWLTLSSGRGGRRKHRQL